MRLISSVMLRQRIEVDGYRQCADTIAVMRHHFDRSPMRRMLLLIGGCLIVLMACPVPSGPSDQPDGNVGSDPELPDPVAAPSFSPPPGIYASDFSVAITTPTSGATIFYTTDGSTPDETDTEYTAPIAFAGDYATISLTAVATKTGYPTSDLATASYEIDYATVSQPEFSTTAGTYSHDIIVELSTTTSGATIHYTTDGSQPTAASPVYTSSIDVADDGTSIRIRAIAERAGMKSSSVADGVFTIDYVMLAPSALAATNVEFAQVDLAWQRADLAEEYIVERYYVPTPGPPTRALSFLWEEIYRGTDTSHVDVSLWGGSEIYYRVSSLSDGKGTATSDYIRVDTPVGQLAFRHDYLGSHTYSDANAYVYRSGNTWYFNVMNDRNNQSADREVYGYLIAIGTGPTFSDPGTGGRLVVGSTEYLLENITITLSSVGQVGSRVVGTFNAQVGTTAVVGTISMIRLPDN